MVARLLQVLKNNKLTKWHDCCTISQKRSGTIVTRFGPKSCYHRATMRSFFFGCNCATIVPTCTVVCRSNHATIGPPCFVFVFFQIVQQSCHHVQFFFLKSRQRNWTWCHDCDTISKNKKMNMMSTVVPPKNTSQKKPKSCHNRATIVPQTNANCNKKQSLHNRATLVPTIVRGNRAIIVQHSCRRTIKIWVVLFKCSIVYHLLEMFENHMLAFANTCASHVNLYKYLQFVCGK